MGIIVKIYANGFIGKSKGSSAYSIVKEEKEAYVFKDTNTAMTAISLLGINSDDAAFQMKM